MIPQGYEKGLVPALMLPLARRLLDRVRVVPGDLVLDAAAGTGAVGRQIPDARVVAADSWDEMVAFGRTITPAARWALADLEALPFRSGAFDVVFCQHALPFAEDPARAVGEMARVARPGGRVGILLWTGLARSPGFAALGRAVAARLGEERGIALRFPDAIETPQGLHALLAAAGLAGTVERLRHEARFASPAAFVRAYVAGSYLAEILDAQTERAIAQEVEDALAGWSGPDGLSFPVETHLAVGVSGREL